MSFIRKPKNSSNKTDKPGFNSVKDSEIAMMTLLEKDDAMYAGGVKGSTRTGLWLCKVVDANNDEKIALVIASNDVRDELGLKKNVYYIAD
jgi:hypothetical protein